MKHNTHSLRRGVGVLLVLVLSGGCASLVTPNRTVEFAELRAGSYTVDPEHVFVNVEVDHLGLSKAVGRFNTVDASLDFDPDNPEALQLDGRVDVASIDFNNPTLERRLRGDDWFATETWPEAAFTTTDVRRTGDNRLAVTGDFNWRGITRPLTLDVVFNGGADNLLTGRYTLGFSATGSLSRSDYGVDGFAALVGDRIALSINAEFQRER